MVISSLDISRDYRIVYSEKGYKPLCFIEKDLLVYKEDQFFLIGLNSFSKKHICNLDIGKKYKKFSQNRLLVRLLRLEPRGVAKVDENNILLCFKGTIYHLNIEEKKIKKVHNFRSGMSAPLYLSVIKNIKGFKNRYCYGEYFSNPEMDEVSIYGCREDSFQWNEIYRFKKGEINHIHSIIPDPYQNRVWIFTGDYNDAATIWYTEDDFKTVRKYLSEKQQYRACVGFPTPKGLIYATDTPLENNSIWFVSIDKKMKRLYDIEGSSIYGAKLKDAFILSTVVEGHADGKQGFWSLLSYKRGKGIKGWNSNLIVGNLEDGFKTIGTFKKDLLPMGLMQFGTITFPSGNNPTDKIVLYGNSLQGLDGRLLVLNKKEGLRD